MDINENEKNKFLTKIIDFFVLGISFYFSCYLLSIHLEVITLVETFVYSSIGVLSILFGKHLLSNAFSSAGAIVKLMINNAFGLLIGAIIMLVFGRIYPVLGEFSIAIALASVMSFFVLGTLSPLLTIERHSKQ